MNKTPKLRFKEFSGEWEYKTLESISTHIKRTSDEVIENILTISAGRGFLDQKDRFSQVIAGNSLSKYTLLDKNEFAYNRGNSKKYTYGCIYRLKDHDQALVPNVYISFKLNNQIEKFYEQLFAKKYLDRQLRQLISSGARMDGLLNINKAEFFKVKVPVPTLEEQKKISTLFSLIDNKISLQGDKVEALKDYKVGIVQKIFSRELRFKDDDGNYYPEWKDSRLESIVDKKKKGKNAIYTESGNILLNNEYMDNGAEPMYVENEIDVNREDILILWDGSQAGKMYTGFTGVLGSTFTAITLDKCNCNQFIYQQLISNLDKIQIAWREGSGVPHVAKDFIANFKIKVPVLEEQRKIAKLLDSIDIKLKKEQNKLDSLNEYKKGLLQQIIV